MRVLAGGDLHVVRAPRAQSVSPDVHPAMEVETIRAEGGDIDLVVKIAGRTLVLMTGEGGVGTFLGADERRTRLTGHLSPALALAVRWLVTGEGLG